MAVKAFVRQLKYLSFHNSYLVDFSDKSRIAKDVLKRTRQRTTVQNSGLALLKVFEYKLVQLHLACQTQDVTCLMR